MDIFLLVIFIASCRFLVSDTIGIQDCKLSPDDSFLYKTLDGGDVDPGSLIQHGTRLEVYCRDVYLGDYTYESEAYNDVLQVECSNGNLGQIELKCKQGDPETCTTLANGSVKRMFLNEYEVSCNEGYALNLMRPDLPYCKCLEDKLVCKYGGQTPKCEPEPCKIPYSYDNRLTIFIRREGSVINLSGGVSVDVGETLFFNCINTDSKTFEPNNRRFECKNGKWLEDDENDKEWNLGYNGEFPICRNASCEPLCINGGKCIRDDRCQCPDLTSGTRCEEVLCDAECKKNDGTCIAPGTCGMCPTGKYGNNCEHIECDPECQKNGGKCIAPGKCGKCPVGKLGNNCQDYGCLLPKDAPKIEVPKESYEIGEIINSDQFVCPANHLLMPRNGMICLRGGWTETAKCIANDQRETGDLFTSVICGLRPMELESRKKRGITERELASPNFQRILGGSTAPKGLHPWQVGVRKLILFGLLDMHLCGGTILSEYWILSVAHCFTDLPKSYVTVRVGDHNNNHLDDFEQEFELEHLIIHSQYNESTFDYDIALLKIKPKNGTGIKFGYIVQPACLPDQTSSYVDGQKCHVSGWGKTEYGLSGMLQSARVPIINDKTCRKLYNRTFTPRMTITPQMVCAGYLEGGADTCEGDSGGPLVCDINSRYTVMGATSWGNGCGKADAPGVYARVAAFVPWIKAKVKEYS